jgi:hypothetical protein
VRVDGPREMLLLSDAKGSADLQRRAARMVRRLLGAAMDASTSFDDVVVDHPDVDNGFTVTDGRRTYSVTMIEVDTSPTPLLMFIDDIPPADTDLWIVHRVYSDARAPQKTEMPGGVICFATGTMIRTQDGARRVEDLGEGDLIQTKDDGLQPVLWAGRRRMSGARLYAMPELRPVRIRAGALNDDEPESDLLVSPNHRILIKGPAAKLLFNTDEVLVSARDLINDGTVMTDHKLREVTYVHLLLDNHQIVWANGVQSESFHPANMSLDAIDGRQRERLFAALPDIAADVHSYGDYARRNLSASEAAILRHDSGKFRPLGH